MPASNNLAIDLGPETFSSLSNDTFTFEDRSKTATNTSAMGSIGFFRFPKLSEGAVQIITKLQSYKLLLPNWDGNGAIAPPEDVVDKVISFVHKAEKNLLPFYFVAPGPNGEIVIEFKRMNREASVYFNADGSTELVLNEGNNFVLEGTPEEHYKNLLTFINT
jgi:hypothetical protein